MIWFRADPVNIQSKCWICHYFVCFLPNVGSAQDSDRMADNSRQTALAALT
jgi:hypothetical protein